MAYSDFSLADIEREFGIKNRRKRLFESTHPIESSIKLKETLLEAEELPVRSEKAKSEWIVVPVLRELRNRNDKYFTIYSGDVLNADETKGLKGECDFILAKDIGSFDINFPIIQVVEAKKNDVEIGVPQCAAQLVGAKIYNQKKGVELSQIYGCVTTGNEWLFMSLTDTIWIDTKLYYLSDIENILGIFQYIIDYYKKEIN
ncbi:MAG: hypothetical protein MUF45_08070 [Spirosomaceae bacterium]|jgi:hypothetical protein|nr:hypothetical protein [Spirosomataceae bacterium]